MTQLWEHKVHDLLTKIEINVNDNTTDLQAEAVLLHEVIIAWCESKTPPSSKALLSVQEKLNSVLNIANSEKKDAYNSLRKHQKGNKAISAYKTHLVNKT